MNKRKEIEFCITCILKRPRKFISISKEFLLSHHPSCEYYRNDYIEIRGVKLCIGCFFTTPVVIILVLLDIFDNFWEMIYPFILAIVLSLILIQALYYLNILGRSKLAKVFSKITLGVLYSIILLYPMHLPLRYFFRVMLTFLTYMLLNATIASIRVYKNEKTCRKCPMYRDYPFCDGYRELVEKWIHEGFAKIKYIQ